MRRQLTGKWQWISSGVAIAFTAFQLYTGAFGLFPALQQRAIHILFGFALTLLLVAPAKTARPQNKVPWWDIILILLVIASSFNAYLRYEWWVFHLTESSTLDLFLGAVLVILVIETGRRMTGWVFPMLTAAALIYAFVGPYIPGTFGHRGFSIVFVIQQLYQGTNGVFGFVTGLSATMIAMFFIFVALLLFTGGGRTFIDLAMMIAGRFRGGPALVAVLASSLFAMISGGPSTNVAATGSFTIPMMKGLGYKPHFAGAVEATASTGGQITPPVMGAGAFVMAELLGIPYVQVAIAAIIPAFLYYAAVFSSVRLEALKENLAPVPSDQIPKVREVLTWKRLGPLFLPVGALVTLLLQGFTEVTSALIASVIAALLFFFTDFSPSGMKQRAKKLLQGMRDAGISLIHIVPLLVCANIVVTLIGLTGVGVKLSGLVTQLAGDSVLIALIIAAVVAMVMGMGLPTVASYVIAVAIIGPVLTTLGVLPIAANMFIFFFAILSNITPPVCLAVYIAAGIAQASWLKVAAVALRLALVAYFIPFFFVFQPALLAQGDIASIPLPLLTAITGAVFLGVGLTGYFTFRLGVISRVPIVVGAGLMLVPQWQTDLIGIGLIAVTLLANLLVRPLLSQRKASPGSEIHTKPPGTYIDLDSPDT